LLGFYKRLDMNGVQLDKWQKELIEGCDYFNSNVYDFVISGKFEAWYTNSYLWRQEGSLLVKFEDLINFPLETMTMVCNHIRPVSEKIIRGACVANSFSFFNAQKANQVHISKISDNNHRAYDWSNFIQESQLAQEIYDYVRNSPIFQPYITRDVTCSTKKLTDLEFSSDTSSFIQKLFFLSDYYRNIEDENIALKDFLDYAYKPIDRKPIKIPGFAMEIWKWRYDLQEAFPEPMGRDRYSFLSWLLNSSILEYDIPAAYFRDTYLDLVSFQK
jgi:hypothetical protein